VERETLETTPSYPENQVRGEAALKPQTRSQSLVPGAFTPAKINASRHIVTYRVLMIRRPSLALSTTTWFTPGSAA
jgi:hypothetical protein